MFETIAKSIREFFTPAPVQDYDRFQRLKAQHPMSNPMPATMGQARQMARQFPKATEYLMKVLAEHDRYHKPTPAATPWGCACKRRWMANAEIAPVGEISKVGRLISPRHLVGMEISTGEDGWTLERLELSNHAYEVLCHRGTVRGAHHISIIRSESAGPLRRK